MAINSNSLINSNIKYSTTKVQLKLTNNQLIKISNNFFSKKIDAATNKLSQYIWNAKSITENNLETSLEYAMNKLKALAEKRESLSDQQLFETKLEIQNILTNLSYKAFLNSNKGEKAHEYLNNILLLLAEIPNNNITEDLILKEIKQISYQEYSQISKLQLKLDNYPLFKLKLEEINKKVQNFNTITPKYTDNLENLLNISTFENDLEFRLYCIKNKLKELARKEKSLSDQQLFEIQLELKNILNDNSFNTFLNSKQGETASCYLENILFKLKEITNNNIIENFILKEIYQIPHEQCNKIAKLQLVLDNHLSFKLKFEEIEKKAQNFNELTLQNTKKLSEELNNSFEKIRENEELISKNLNKQEKDILLRSTEKRLAKNSTFNTSINNNKILNNSNIEANSTAETI